MNYKTNEKCLFLNLFKLKQETWSELLLSHCNICIIIEYSDWDTSELHWLEKTAFPTNIMFIYVL